MLNLVIGFEGFGIGNCRMWVYSMCMSISIDVDVVDLVGVV